MLIEQPQPAHRHAPRARCAIRIVAASALLIVLSACSAQADVIEARQQLDARYRAALEELAAWCDGQKLDAEAKRARSWALPVDPLSIVVPTLARMDDAPPAADAAEPLKQWHARFRKLRQQQAEALFSLAREAVKEHRATLAFELVHLTARENPDHEAARRILGYVKYEGAWHTPFEVDKAGSKQVWDDRFGWILRNRLDRYQKGERFNRGRWVSAEEDARLSTDIAQGWNIVTEHFTVRTNLSQGGGVRVASLLEHLYRSWRQAFVLYYATDADIARWLQGAKPGLGKPRNHQVYFYRTKEEYVAALSKAEPHIDQSIGYYQPSERRSSFFGPEKDDPNEDSAILHEATHQLFTEVRNSNTPIADQRNFWIVEGIACYMESYTEHDGYITLGGNNADRLKDAERRLLVNELYVPLEELAALGRTAFQSDQRMRQLYTQSAGLAHFLMHYDGGRYRDALVDYLFAIYSGQDKLTTLSELTGTSYSELDRQYRQFIASLKKK